MYRDNTSFKENDNTMYNDIRYVDLGEEIIPVGHPNIISYTSKEPSNTVEFFLMNREDESTGSVGFVTIFICMDKASDVFTIKFPISNAVPIGNTFTVSGNTNQLIVDSVDFEVFDGHESKISMTLPEDVNAIFHVVAVATPGLVIDAKYTSEEGDEEWIPDEAELKLNPAREPLIANLDYGEQRPDIGRVGQIFYELKQ